MAVDPTVEKVVTDVNTFITIVQQVLGALTGAQGQVLQLTNEVATLNQEITQLKTQISGLQAGGIGPDNTAALAAASTALEAETTSAKAAIGVK